MLASNLDEKLPHHSSLTRIRQRWGREKFYKIFQYTVQACVAAKLVNVDTVHVDATLIRANVSWDSIPKEHAKKVMQENNGRSENQARDTPGANGSKKIRRKSTTDPEATLSTSSRNRKLEPYSPATRERTPFTSQNNVRKKSYVIAGDVTDRVGHGQHGQAKGQQHTQHADPNLRKSDRQNGTAASPKY